MTVCLLITSTLGMIVHMITSFSQYHKYEDVNLLYFWIVTIFFNFMILTAIGRIIAQGVKYLINLNT
ncbi:hypothetical protein [Alkaliphilus sp. B6464]|uniref:hypothetical protein n=1 Tax=Alkaliphilus sp. B6464 TaxID=2731219 RepID=UPI001BACF3B2|nr:hypothetical protein [Alkaliphilus sp. B6464]QUH22101.1 hypothetical protein HYG84_19535 [Alkaliphilus sp. B6464]